MKEFASQEVVFSKRKEFASQEVVISKRKKQELSSRKGKSLLLKK